MQREEIIELLRETGVMLEGHFKLTSGRHSDRYMQCAKLFCHPDAAERLCRQAAAAFAEDQVACVISPAIGGILMGYETARALGVRNLFAERENGVMTLRRGFAVQPGERVLIAEDVITTGGSVREVIDLVRAAGGVVAGVVSVVDRSNGKVDFGVPFRPLLSMEITSWEAADCPLCAAGAGEAVKPGSRTF